jgi:RNA polymerase-binding transcription factor DksA
MATASRKSLASRAGAAARKVVSRTSPTSAAAAKKATAKKAAQKSAPVKKASVKKAPVKKAPAAKKAATKAPATKAVAKKSVAKKSVAKKVAPAKQAPATKAAAKKTTTKTAQKTAPVKKAAVKTPEDAAVQAAVNAPVKKVAAKRAAAPGKLMVLEVEDPWTKAELDGVRRQLTDDVERLTGELVEVEGDLAGMIANSGEGAGNDQADVGSASFERDQEMVIVNNARDMLVQSQHALERIADGSYGQCEICGNAIGKNRLIAFPRATLCLSCKQREERR